VLDRVPGDPGLQVLAAVEDALADDDPLRPRRRLPFAYRSHILGTLRSDPARAARQGGSSVAVRVEQGSSADHFAPRWRLGFRADGHGLSPDRLRAGRSRSKPRDARAREMRSIDK